MAADPTIIYIAGSGRSGSTILDNILAQVPSVCSVGELRSLWKQGLLEDGRCGCGVRVSECPFWTQVRDLAFPDGWPDPAEMAATQHRYFRLRPSTLLLLARRDPHLFPPEVRRYVTSVERIYRVVAAMTGASVVVDSSKNPADCLAITRMSTVDMRVAHLVRDPRAVAYSLSRPKAAPDRAAGQMATAGPLRCATRWTIVNGIVSLAVRRQRPYTVIRYEDFTADPAAVVATLGDLAGVNLEVPLEQAGIPNRHVVHGPAGNPDRMARQGATLEVRADDRWRRDMRSAAKLCASLPTAPMVGRFGYSIHPGRRR